MRHAASKKMNEAQRKAVEALRRAIDRMDRVHRGPVAKGRSGRRCQKVWNVRVLADGAVEVVSVVGWKREDGKSHPFDDIKRVVRIGRRGGLSGFGNIGHGDAGDSRDCRGPRVLYAIDAERVY